MPGKSVTIECICKNRFNIAADQVPMPNEPVKELCCPGCGGTWRLGWDPRSGDVRMMPPEQRHKPAEWGLKPRLTAEDIKTGDVWIEADDA